ncbi:MAG: MarR family transcriptional regulator [Spirochaetaceae bacterium]|nr:MarR family transcriptional regulator [Spirochaetaceae bacterium]
MIVNRKVGALFRMGDAFLNRELEATGLTSGSAYLVLELAAGGTLNLTELSRRVGVDRAHSTRMARLLEEGGFIHRTTDPDDGRGTLLSLSAKGRHAAAAVEKAMLAWVALITEGVAPEDLAATGRSFDRFYENAVAAQSPSAR